MQKLLPFFCIVIMVCAFGGAMCDDDSADDGGECKKACNHIWDTLTQEEICVDLMNNSASCGVTESEWNNDCGSMCGAEHSYSDEDPWSDEIIDCILDGTTADGIVLCFD